MEEDDWNKAKELLSKDHNDVRAEITLMGNTVLHVAVLAGKVKMVEELANLMSEEDVEKQNNFGFTAFSLAALYGILEMVKPLLAKNAKLATLENKNGQIPVVTASLYGKRDMIRYLYSKTPTQFLCPESNAKNAKNGATLLNCLIIDGIYGMYIVVNFALCFSTMAISI